MLEYNVVEIFKSLQGEGFNTGMPAIFLRLGKCNLACPWCDTDYLKYKKTSINDILQTLENLDCKNIIITGGEPAVVPKIEVLLDELKERGYYLLIETNALEKIPAQIDYISASPKAMYWDRYNIKHISKANEVRIVADDVKDIDIYNFCLDMESKIKADNYYISPLEVNGQMNIFETITLLGRLNSRKNNSIHWNLSIQTHKLAGIE